MAWSSWRPLSRLPVLAQSFVTCAPRGVMQYSLIKEVFKQLKMLIIFLFIK